jgi:dsDNA-specific endonuclease/ATPase MutS2
LKRFKPGDLVEVIDENLVGRVAFAKAGIITIITEDGFYIDYNSKSLLPKTEFEVNKVPQAKASDVSSAEVRNIHIETDQNNALVIDLHIHEFLENDRYMTSFEKLSAQLNRAIIKLEKARSEKIPKLVFIHGVGKGVLKERLHELLNAQPDLEYYDASFSKYGKGATEVKIYRF